ncbi:protein-tyrosine phosphatase family protein [Gynuella sp.]|uniref:protein-tyrosine phosphatase family protein n=1 Tax=Gynuella sp. TaxID=2969146 RepID=UPI003D1179EB
MTPDIYKVEEIGSGCLFVMAKPVSGEWIEDEFTAIARFGIHKIVSLLEEQEAIDVGLSRERELAEKNGMEFISFPIPDRGLPHSVARFTAFTKRLYHEMAGGVNTVIHCRAGIGRTGIVAAGVLLQCGFEPLGAFEYISQKRGVSVPDTQEQIDWVTRYCGDIVNT